MAFFEEYGIDLSSLDEEIDMDYTDDINLDYNSADIEMAKSFSVDY